MTVALMKSSRSSKLPSASFIFSRLRFYSSAFNQFAAAQQEGVSESRVPSQIRSQFDRVPKSFRDSSWDEMAEKTRGLLNPAMFGCFYRRPMPGWSRSLSTSGSSEETRASANISKDATHSEDTMDADVEEVIEDPGETKPGWVLKVIVALTVAYMAFHGFPMIGEGTIRHSLALLKAEDPIFKRSGASRVALFANTDDKRKSVVKAGGVQRLISMLEGASDDHTRREALKALVALAHCEEAVLILLEEGADAIFKSLVSSSSDSDVVKLTSVVLEKLGKESSGSLKQDLPQMANSTICAS